MDAYIVRFQNSYSSATDTTVGDPLYGQTLYYLQPSSTTQGIEFESTAVLAKGLNLYLNATASNAFYRGNFNVNASSGSSTAPAIWGEGPLRIMGGKIHPRTLRCKASPTRITALTSASSITESASSVLTTSRTTIKASLPPSTQSIPSSTTPFAVARG